jgi:hypothetical protein
MTEIRLDTERARTAQGIQESIDSLGVSGGRVLLPEGRFVLDRGIELRSRVQLAGRGERTVLVKAPGRRYPLTGYHNYGMCDVPLSDLKGLEPGMTVSVQDKLRGGFYGTFARISWVEAGAGSDAGGGWVGLDHGIEADYTAEAEPALTLAFPLVFAHGVRGASLCDLAIEGSRASNPEPMNGCRGGAIYFARCRDVVVQGVRERDYNGEGMSFQMCARVTICDSSFDANAGNGLHPGAGSTGAVFERCRGRGNDRSGLFFCVRANHITVSSCEIAENGEHGISIGTRDCHNLVKDCAICGNDGAGIWVRPDPHPVEVHSCRFEGCILDSNGKARGLAQIEIPPDAHDLVFSACEVRGGGGAGLRARPGARAIDLVENRFTGCSPDLDARVDALGPSGRPFSCGAAEATAADYRHLPR